MERGTKVIDRVQVCMYPGFPRKQIFLKLFMSSLAALMLLCANFRFFFSLKKSIFKKIKNSKHVLSEKMNVRHFFFASQPVAEVS